MTTADPLAGPFPTGQMLTRYDDDPEFAIPVRPEHPEQKEAERADCGKEG